jgi:hypothetical protein
MVAVENLSWPLKLLFVGLGILPIKKIDLKNYKGNKKTQDLPKNVHG